MAEETWKRSCGVSSSHDAPLNKSNPAGILAPVGRAAITEPEMAPESCCIS